MFVIKQVEKIKTWKKTNLINAALPGDSRTAQRHSPGAPPELGHTAAGARGTAAKGLSRSMKCGCNYSTAAVPKTLPCLPPLWKVLGRAKPAGPCSQSCVPFSGRGLWCTSHIPTGNCHGVHPQHHMSEPPHCPMSVVAQPKPLRTPDVEHPLSAPADSAAVPLWATQVLHRAPHAMCLLWHLGEPEHRLRAEYVAGGDRKPRYWLLQQHKFTGKVISFISNFC